MDVIPVLDLQDGRVVQGLRGDRRRYLPITSVLVAGAEPLPVAAALQRELNVTTFYVADLDAIERTGDHHHVIHDLTTRLGLDLWVDAGTTDTASAIRLLENGAARVVVGTETLQSLAALREMREALAPEQLLLSLDVGSDGVLSRCPALRGLHPVAALEALSTLRLSEVIVLTLDRVGTGGGPGTRLLSAIRARFPDLSLIAGGGVRTAGDIRQLDGLGVAGALVATSVHRGWMTGADIEAARHGP